VQVPPVQVQPGKVGADLYAGEIFPCARIARNAAGDRAAKAYISWGSFSVRRDPVSGRGVWFAYGPAGSFLGSPSTRQQAAHVLETNMLRMLTGPRNSTEPEWPEW
jgi:hypothetical protein